jgi:hypothetical protein
MYIVCIYVYIYKHSIGISFFLFFFVFLFVFLFEKKKKKKKKGGDLGLEIALFKTTTKQVILSFFLFLLRKQSKKGTRTVFYGRKPRVLVFAFSLKG